MIARTWRGATPAGLADRYVEYMLETGVKGYRETPGNQGVLLLRRPVDDNVEFLFVTLWDSLDAIRSFAGEDLEQAVFYPQDDAFLVERDLTATHYDVVPLDRDR